jgi:hypothetical protein
MVKAGLVWLVFFTYIITGQGQVIENYQSQIHFSYERDVFQRTAAAIVSIDPISFPKSDFRLELPKRTAVFIGQKLWLATEEDSVFEVPSGFFRETFLGEGEKELTLEIFNTYQSLSDLKIYKGYFEDTVVVQPSFESNSLWQEREKSDFSDFFYVALIVLMLLFAVFKTIFPSVFELIVSPGTVFSAEDFSDSGGGFQKFFSIDVLFYLLLLNLGISLVGFLFIEITEYLIIFEIGQLDFNRLLLFWLLGAMALTLLSILKFIFLKIMVYLFDLTRFDFAHFFYLLRIISISMLIVLGLGFYFYLNNSIVLENVLVYSFKAFFWLYLVGVVFMFVIMVNRIPFKNYHLFAYICTAELIPFLVLSKLIIG